MNVNVPIKPSSFSDDQEFNPYSTPEVTAPLLQPSAPVTVNVQQQEETTKVVYKKVPIPWPPILMAIMGVIIVVFTAVAPGIPNDRRLFGVIILTLWTIVWALILWVLWREGRYGATWWLLLIPSAIMILFFVVIIILKVGAP